MLGYTYEEIKHTAQQWTDFIHPDDRDRAWRSINDVLEGRSASHKAEYRMLHKDGSIRWILDQANVMKRDANGIPTRMSGTHTDVTERKQTEQLLHLNEERLRLALAVGNQGWFDLNVQTGEVTVSPEYVRMLGYDPQAFHSSLEEWKSNLHPDDREAVKETLNKPPL